MQQRNILILCTDLNIGGAQAVAANISKYAPDHLRMTYLVFREQPGDYGPAILSRGDLMGCVMLLTEGGKDFLAEADQKIAQTAAGFLGRQMEN